MARSTPVVIDPRDVGLINGDIDETCLALSHVQINREAIDDASNRLHQIAEVEIQRRLEERRTVGKQSRWVTVMPHALRRGVTAAERTARAERKSALAEERNVTDHDRSNYLGMMVAIDYRHWFCWGEASSAASVAPTMDPETTAETVTLPPHTAVDARQFWHRAANGTWCRGSTAMMTSLREAVDDQQLHWYRPDALVDPTLATEDLFAGMMTYRVQPRGELPPTASVEAAIAAAQWPLHRIPALRERWNMLREIAARLNDMNGAGDGAAAPSSFYELAHMSNGRLFNNGNGFIERLVALHPRYDDAAPRSVLLASGSTAPEDSGKVVHLLKLAQLTALALIDSRAAFEDPSVFNFDDLDSLAVCPDYQLPKALRACGVLTYSPALAALVDGDCLLAPQSAEEVELRLASMVAARMLQRRLSEIHQVDVVDMELVDFILWRAGSMCAASRHHLTIGSKY
jgi:hypothetical protein